MGTGFTRAIMRIGFVVIVSFLTLLVGCAVFQRKLLYYPTHHRESNGLSEWRDGDQLIGYAREVPSPAAVWLMLHGNGGQASDRVYALPSFSGSDSVFMMEYPGYGSRPGSPSMAAFNSAARRAYELLRSRFPSKPVCVVGESIGTGPASFLAASPHPPDKIVLIAPFDVLAHVAAHHLPYLPMGLLLRDNWNNVKALRVYEGPLEIFAARDDTIIPAKFAMALAETKPVAKFHLLPGDHNDWPMTGRVEIRYP